MKADMFNDEQLAHLEILQKEAAEALSFWKERALFAEAKVANNWLISEHYETVCAERDLLRERLDKEEEERGRQYGMRVQAEERAAFLLELLRATVRTGTKDPLLDARLAEEIRSHE